MTTPLDTVADGRRHHRSPSAPARPLDFRGDAVVLLDRLGRPAGTASKADIHSERTPLHLGVSCHVIDRSGRVLVTRRAHDKRTFPGIWTNSCCGHPRPGEAPADAVRRHLEGELGVSASSVRCVLPDFTYRAVAADGIVEHEVCPVFVAEVDGAVAPNPIEVDDATWVPWTELVRRASSAPGSLSPWSVAQIGRIAALTDDVRRLLDVPPWHVDASSVDATWEVVSSRRSVVAPGLVAPGLAAADSLLDDLLQTNAAAIRDIEPAAGELVRAISTLVRSGGKRIRPTFVTWGYLAAGHDDPAAVAPAAAAVELLHTFALLQDDVMDEATMRRGQECAHVRFASLRDDRGATVAHRFGESAAVLAGDLALTWSHGLLADATARTPGGSAARQVFATLCNEVVVGQYLDLRMAGAPCDDATALTISLLKSARYSVTRPLELGAVLGGADTATIERLRAYGDAAGTAFQLRDDVIGVFGHDGVAGKGCTDDLREAKASLLLVRALALATPSAATELRGHLGNPALTRADAERCREIIAASGALASVERLIEANTATARQIAATLPPPVGDALAGLAVLLADRAA